MEEKKRIGLKEEPWRVILNTAYSIEGMEGHGAGDRSVSYTGSLPGIKRKDKNGQGEVLYIYDLYRDSRGKYWYETCVKLSSGRVVPFGQYVFGKEIKRR
jgi:hypothetical protein